MSSDPISIARACYEAFVDSDRVALEALIADDFHFTSSLDNRIDRETYFARCWPQSSAIEGYDFIRFVADGERVYVTYDARTTDGRRFRNTEILTVRGDQLVGAEVYFGWSFPHPASVGRFIEAAGRPDNSFAATSRKLVQKTEVLMNIRDVMTPNAEVIDANVVVREAAAKMRELDVGSLPVCDGGKLCGVITDRDIAIRLVAEGRDGLRVKVGEIMTPELTYCFDDQTVEEAAGIMEAHQIRRLPILDRGQQLVGILSLGDLAVRTLGTDDHEFADEILEEISEPAEPRRHSN